MTASDGSYTASLSIASGDVTKPLVVQAECPNTGGGNYVLVTVTPTHASGTVNVNPLTNLISAADGKYAADAILMGVELLSRRPDRSEIAQYFSVLQLLP